MFYIRSTKPLKLWKQKLIGAYTILAYIRLKLNSMMVAKMQLTQFCMNILHLFGCSIYVFMSVYVFIICIFEL